MTMWLFFEQAGQLIPVSEIAGIFAVPRKVDYLSRKHDCLSVNKVIRYPKLDNGDKGMLVRRWQHKQVRIDVTNATKALAAISLVIAEGTSVIIVEDVLRRQGLLVESEKGSLA